jgi:hypothetical protein
MAGYHLISIPKGEIGEISKIQEEVLELEDAFKQGAKIMALCELSDLYGAMEAFIERHHPGSTMKDIRKMSKLTRRSFKVGERR